jgi:hypothetical protein
MTDQFSVYLKNLSRSMTIQGNNNEPKTFTASMQIGQGEVQDELDYIPPYP